MRVAVCVCVLSCVFCFVIISVCGRRQKCNIQCRHKDEMRSRGASLWENYKRLESVETEIITMFVRRRWTHRSTGAVQGKLEAGGERSNADVEDKRRKGGEKEKRRGGGRCWCGCEPGFNPAVLLSAVFLTNYCHRQTRERELMRGARLWSVRTQSGERR